jgi:universal stress protein A
MPEIRRILCPVDFSSTSREAMRFAADLAQRFGASMTLLHVYPVPGYVLPEGFLTAGPDVLAEVEERTHASLAEWQAEVHKIGVTEVEIATAMGNAASEIVRHAVEDKADMVVMGTHGRTGLAKLVLGSVADKVVRMAGCPVLTVPSRHHRHDPKPAA